MGPSFRLAGEYAPAILFLINTVQKERTYPEAKDISLPCPETVPTEKGKCQEWPVAIRAHKCRRRTAMPRIQVLAIVEYNLRLWVRSNQFSSKD